MGSQEKEMTSVVLPALQEDVPLNGINLGDRCYRGPVSVNSHVENRPCKGLIKNLPQWGFHINDYCSISGLLGKGGRKRFIFHGKTGGESIDRSDAGSAEPSGPTPMVSSTA